MKRRFAVIALAAACTLAVPTTAGAAPSRVRCEAVAKAAADRVARVGTVAWHKAYANAWVACATGQTSPFKVIGPLIPVSTGPWWSL